MIDWLYQTLFISPAGYWVGAVLLGLAAAALLWIVTSPTEVRMGPAPVFPKPFGAGDQDEAVVSTGGPTPEVHVAHRVRTLLELPDLLGAP